MSFKKGNRVRVTYHEMQDAEGVILSEESGGYYSVHVPTHPAPILDGLDWLLKEEELKAV